MEFEPLHTLLAVMAFLLGAMVGSFLNVCVHRWPKGLSIISPRSRCPSCETPLTWLDNIPILSWLFLGARCRHCGAVISWQYPVVEALTATLFLAVFWRFGVSDATPIYMAMAAALVLVTFVDLTDWTIPNEVTMPGIPLGIVCSLYVMFNPESALRIEAVYEDVFHALIGAAVGGGSLFLVDRLSLILLGKRGMGMGDVKLLAMLGAFFGWKGVIFIFMVAAVAGSVVGIAFILAQKIRGEEEIEHYLPFGPYLSLGGVVMMLVGEPVFEYYHAFLDVPIEPELFL